MEIRYATVADEAMAATSLFDHPARREWAEKFLDQPGHHLYLAWDGDEVVGFVRGVARGEAVAGGEVVLPSPAAAAAPDWGTSPSPATTFTIRSSAS